MASLLNYVFSNALPADLHILCVLEFKGHRILVQVFSSFSWKIGSRHNPGPASGGEHRVTRGKPVRFLCCPFPQQMWWWLHVPPRRLVPSLPAVNGLAASYTSIHMNGTVFQFSSGFLDDKPKNCIM